MFTAIRRMASNASKRYRRTAQTLCADTIATSRESLRQLAGRKVVFL
jgi:hypothetical protein